MNTQNILIKISFCPEKNYCGSDMVDYKIIREDIALILDSYI